MPNYDAIKEAEIKAADAEAMVAMRNRIAQGYGERCPDHDPECWVCQAWHAFDTLCYLFHIDPHEVERQATSASGAKSDFIAVAVTYPADLTSIIQLPAGRTWGDVAHWHVDGCELHIEWNDHPETTVFELDRDNITPDTGNPSRITITDEETFDVIDMR